MEQELEKLQEADRKRKAANRKRGAEFRRRENQKVQDPLGIDATRVSRLGKEQLQHLRDRIVISEVDNRGFPEAGEEYFCHYAKLPFHEDKRESSTGNKRHKEKRYQAMVIYKGQVDKNAPDYYPTRANQPFAPAQVVLCASGKHAEEKFDQASHLCDNAFCLRAEHLVWESPQNNSDRKNCPGKVRCNCCEEVHDVCKHEPPCIKMTM
jgi:hypothetical protein